MYKIITPILLLLSSNLFAGEGVDLYKSGNYKQSFDMLSNNPEKSSNFYLGVMSFLGRGTPANINKAIDFWAMGWENKDEKSGISLALHLLSSKDPSGITLLTNVADSGSMNAQYELGKAFYNQKSSHFNLKSALFWFTQAGNQGKKEAQANLGLMYYYGDGADKDLELSKSWYTKSANQGFQNAQYALGVLLSKTDKDKAVYWLKKAANQGHIESALTLGDFYQQSETDPSMSIKWFAKAYELGSQDALLPLGILKYSSKDKKTKDDGFLLLNKCNINGNKQCLDVLLRIFMNKRFQENLPQLNEFIK